MVAKPTFYYITGGLFTKVFYSTASSGGLFLLKLQTKTAPTKADAVSVTMILSDLSDNLDFGKNTLRQCLYRNARTGRL